jgi:small subunit ribosomal protein S17
VEKNTETKKTTNPVSSAPDAVVGETERGLAKTRTGYVTSNKMEKTVVVAVSSQKRHKAYGKYVQKTESYYAHDEKNECRVGDEVLIVESRPLSRLKRWRVREITKRAA